jgi:hypothetical protein
MESMQNRRQEARTETDQPVTVTLLGNSDLCFSARLADWSGKGACLEADRDMPVGSLLKIETGDTLLLGEVVYSRKIAGGFRVGAAIEHALYHTCELEVLARKLLGDACETKLRQ